MFQTKLFGIFILFVTSDGVSCQSGEDTEHHLSFNHPVYEDPERPLCDTENQNALAEIKSEIQNLQQLVVGLRQKLDPDFKLPPPRKFS